MRTMAGDAVPPSLLRDGPADAPATLVLAHGASEPMDSPLLAALARGIAASGFEVVRFEFAHMAARRASGTRRPPARVPSLLAEYHAVVRAVRGSSPLFVGGRSLGGRVASLLADEVTAAGLLAFAYPFHPPRRHAALRTEHLRTLQTRACIVQGDRDPFGAPDEIAGYGLSDAIEVHFVPDGDHAFAPRKRSGRTLAQNVESAVRAAVEFVRSVI